MEGKEFCSLLDFSAWVILNGMTKFLPTNSSCLALWFCLCFAKTNQFAHHEDEQISYCINLHSRTECLHAQCLILHDL